MHSFFHLLFILHTLLRYKIDRILLPKTRCLSFWLAPLYWFFPSPKEAEDAKRLHACLLALGPLAIKFGQALSCRVDLLPEAMAKSLEALQDNVPPFPEQEAISIISAHLGGSLQAHFQTFDAPPLASASIAQVHAACRHDGRHVVVKVLRPGIKETIQRDLNTLQMLAGWVEWLHPKRTQLRAKEVVRTYQDVVSYELDLLKEASNYSQMKHNFQNDVRLYVPSVHWDLCSEQILVVERVHGIKINNLPSLNHAQVDFKALAEHGVDIFFQQLLTYNFFHADMHPGNIFVDAQNPLQPRYMAVDFGIVGQLDTQNQRYIALNLLAFLNRDYTQMARLHIDSGWVPKNTSVFAMAASIRAIGESIYAQPLKDIPFATLFAKLLKVASDYQMVVQPQLILLQKTLFNIEALGRMLYPELNIWHLATPHLEKWLVDSSRLAPKFHQFVEKIPVFLDAINSPTPPQTQATNTHSSTSIGRLSAFTFGLFTGLGLLLLLSSVTRTTLI